MLGAFFFVLSRFASHSFSSFVIIIVARLASVFDKVYFQLESLKGKSFQWWRRRHRAINEPNDSRVIIRIQTIDFFLLLRSWVARCCRFTLCSTPICVCLCFFCIHSFKYISIHFWFHFIHLRLTDWSFRLIPHAPKAHTQLIFFGYFAAYFIWLVKRKCCTYMWVPPSSVAAAAAAADQRRAFFAALVTLQSNERKKTRLKRRVPYGH